MLPPLSPVWLDPPDDTIAPSTPSGPLGALSHLLGPYFGDSYSQGTDPLYSTLLSTAAGGASKVDPLAALQSAKTAFSPSGPVTGAGPFKYAPVPGAQFGDSFGAPRYGGGYHTHEGEDLMAPRGTPVYAPFGGQFVRDDNTLGGKAFHLEGARGYVYGAHLRNFTPLLRHGTHHVKPGQLIGYVGRTGDASGGPFHLHFEWHPGGGAAIDPYQYLLYLYGRHK